jgi:hypothetical protein
MNISKGCNGWTATSDIPIEGDLIVRLTTMKSSNGQLVTYAQGCYVKGNMVSFVMFQDFNRRLIASDVKRVTAKTVEAQHLQIDEAEVTTLVRAFYNLEMA